jgi:uncharacterized membrane protein
MTVSAPRWLIVVLLISVGFNLFLGGLMAARLVHAQRDRDMRMPPPVARFFDQLPDQAREGMQGAMRQRQGEMRQRQQALRAARTALGEKLAAEPYDRTAVEAAFADLRQRQVDMRAVAHGALAETAAGLPADQRKRIADFVEGVRR